MANGTVRWLLLFAFGVVGLANAAGVASRTLLLDASRAENAIIAVGERGTILRSNDAARSWTEVRSQTTATLTGVTFANARDGWVVGHDALVLATHDGGESWTKAWQGENLSDSFLDVLALDPAHIIAIGAYDLFLTSADGGKTWTRRKILSDDYHLNRITQGPTGTLYIAGEHGTLLRSRNAGVDWTAIPTTYDGSFYGVLPLDAHTLLAYGLRGRAFRSEDDGETWTAVETDETTLLATAVQLKSRWVVLAGQARKFLVSAPAADRFTPRDVGVLTGVAELLELPDGNVLTLGEAGAVVVPNERIVPPDGRKAAP